MYKNKSLEKYLDDLAAKIPAPGGGSAAALTAAMGASLISMVAQFTIGKQKYLKFTAELKRILLRSERLRGALLQLADEDVIAYRSKDAKKSLAVPVAVCRLSDEALGLCLPLVKKANVHLISDVAAAAVLLEAAFISARFTIATNISGSMDLKKNKRLYDGLKKRSVKVQGIRKQTEVGVGKIIRGKASR